MPPLDLAGANRELVDVDDRRVGHVPARIEDLAQRAPLVDLGDLVPQHHPVDQLPDLLTVRRYRLDILAQAPLDHLVRGY